MAKKVTTEQLTVKVSDVKPGDFFATSSDSIVFYERLNDESEFLRQNESYGTLCFGVQHGEIEGFDPDFEVFILKTTVTK